MASSSTVALLELLDQPVVKLDHRSIGRAPVGLEGSVHGLQVAVHGIEPPGLFLGEVELFHELAHVVPELSSSSVVPVTSAVVMKPSTDRVQLLQERLAAFAGIPVGGSAGGSRGKAR